MKICLGSILLGAFLVLSVTTVSFGQVVFQDDFNGSMNPAWSIKNNDPTLYSISTNGLILRCCSGDMWNGSATYKNLFLITNPVSQNFTFTAKLNWLITSTKGSTQFALVAYDDSGDYVRVDYGGGIEIFSDVAGKLATPDYWSGPTFGTNQFWLQMRKQGTTYSSWFSIDGNTFTQINPAITYSNAHPAYLGIIAMSDPDQTAIADISSVVVAQILPIQIGVTTVGSLPVVIWPAAGTNFVLQMTTNLTSTNWVTVTNGIPFFGLQITNPPGSAFFRLH